VYHIAGRTILYTLKKEQAEKKHTLTPSEPKGATDGIA
jgi:hypothetical protein